MQASLQRLSTRIKELETQLRGFKDGTKDCETRIISFSMQSVYEKLQNKLSTTLTLPKMLEQEEV